MPFSENSEDRTHCHSITMLSSTTAEVVDGPWDLQSINPSVFRVPRVPGTATWVGLWIIDTLAREKPIAPALFICLTSSGWLSKLDGWVEISSYQLLDRASMIPPCWKNGPCEEPEMLIVLCWCKYSHTIFPYWSWIHLNTDECSHSIWLSVLHLSQSILMFTWCVLPIWSWCSALPKFLKSHFQDLWTWPGLPLSVHISPGWRIVSAATTSSPAPKAPQGGVLRKWWNGSSSAAISDSSSELSQATSSP